MTLARMIRLHKLPERPRLLNQGFREMEERDVAEVTALYAAYMARFGLAIVLTEDEVRHQFLSSRGTGPGSKESWKNPRDGQVVWVYVIEVIRSVSSQEVGRSKTTHRTHKRTRSPTSFRSTRFLRPS